MSMLFSRAWDILRVNRILFLPIILLSLVTALLNAGGATNMLALMSVILLDRALVAGWLHQMKVILENNGRTPTWNDFLEGVARHFGVILSGSAAVLLIGFLIMSSISFIAEISVGTPDGTYIQQLFEQKGNDTVSGLEPTEANNPEKSQQLLEWGMFMGVGGLLMAVFLFFVFLWPQYCVFSNVTWVQAWRLSQETILRHASAFFYLVSIWFILKGVIFWGAFSSSPIIQMLCFVGDLFVRTYFNLVFCLFLITVSGDQLSPIPAIPIESEEPPTEQPKNSESEKPELEQQKNMEIKEPEADKSDDRDQ